jgi:benzylsuccinate CoA-transferase BbsF subunit
MRQPVFQGVKVVDFTQAAAGSLVARLLADFGATVVHVESKEWLDVVRVSTPYKDQVSGINRSLTFGNYQANKYGITLNMKHPKARDVAKRLVAWADVLANSRTAGVMEKWGLSYEDVVKIKPDIIMVTVTMQGQRGLYARSRGYGWHTSSLAGFTNVLGWPDGEPILPPFGFVLDCIAFRLTAVAVLAALCYRRRTGKGQFLDISMVEGGINFLIPQVLDYYANGQDLVRLGNRCPYTAPHGAYPCRGNDSWVAIAIFSDEEWREFCKAIGDPQWTKEPRFATLLGRKENEDELDGLISEWTSRLAAEEIMALLQGVGVPAGVVKQTPEVCEDPQLKHRHHFWAVDHTEMGLYHVDSWAFKLSKTQPEPGKGAPCLGEDNHHVYTELLGMSDEEFVNLLSEGVFE